LKELTPHRYSAATPVDSPVPMAISSFVTDPDYTYLPTAHRNSRTEALPRVAISRIQNLVDARSCLLESRAYPPMESRAGGFSGAFPTTSGSAKDHGDQPVSCDVSFLKLPRSGHHGQALRARTTAHSILDHPELETRCSCSGKVETGSFFRLDGDFVRWSDSHAAENTDIPWGGELPLSQEVHEGRRS